MSKIDKVVDLTIAYPNFQLGQIIDPEQANMNNLQIVNKINMLIGVLNKIIGQDASGSSSSFITITPLPDFPDATDVEILLTQIWNFLKSDIASASLGVKDHAGSSTNIQKLFDDLRVYIDTQDGNITSAFHGGDDTLQTQIDTISNTLEEVEKHFTDNEGLIYQNTFDIFELQESLNTTNTNISKNADDIKTNSDDLVALDTRVQDLESYASDSVTRIQGLETLVNDALEVSPNAELASARDSSVTGKHYDNLDARLEEIEASVGDIHIDIPVTSVNGQTGDVVIVCPVTSVNGQTGNVQVNVPVTSVAGKTGDVTLGSSDVGLGSVQNYPIATTAQAQTGTSNSTYMTPLRVAEEIEAKKQYAYTVSDSDYLCTGHSNNVRIVKKSDVTVGYATNCTNGTTTYNIFNEISNLKSTVVSGKTSVANAINGKAGTTLSNQNTFDELANAISQLSTLSLSNCSACPVAGSAYFRIMYPLNVSNNNFYFTVDRSCTGIEYRVHISTSNNTINSYSVNNFSLNAGNTYSLYNSSSYHTASIIIFNQVVYVTNTSKTTGVNFFVGAY